MPSSAPVSASVTLSTCPLGVAKSTSLATSAPTAPLGAAASSSTVGSVGVLLASSTGASFTAVPVMTLVPVTGAATSSLPLVAIVKVALTFAAGVKVTPASSVLTAAMAPDAVHT